MVARTPKVTDREATAMARLVDTGLSTRSVGSAFYLSSASVSHWERKALELILPSRVHLSSKSG